MALAGGGGAGNTAGSGGTAGVGKGLNYVRLDGITYAYAYSGFVTSPASTDTFTLLEFTTGSEFIVAKADFFYPVYTGDNFQYRILMNGENITGHEVIHGADANLINPINLVIAPFTKVELTAKSTVGNAVDQAATVIGRVY